MGSLRCLWGVVLVFCLASKGAAGQAAGIVWLAAQSNADGSYAGGADLATPFQSTAETLQAFFALDEVSGTWDCIRPRLTGRRALRRHLRLRARGELPLWLLHFDRAERDRDALRSGGERNRWGRGPPWPGVSGKDSMPRPIAAFPVTCRPWRIRDIIRCSLYSWRSLVSYTPTRASSYIKTMNEKTMAPLDKLRSNLPGSPSSWVG
jgi:hypothetical protein